jgi:hypothetical protein
VLGVAVCNGGKSEKKPELQLSRLESGMKRSSLVLIIPLTLLLCLSITGQSLWMDEAGTAWLAARSGLRDLAHAAVSHTCSDVQTPLYFVIMWGWAKIFGTPSGRSPGNP